MTHFTQQDAEEIEELKKRLEQQAIRRQKEKMNRIFVDILMEGMKGNSK